MRLLMLFSLEQVIWNFKHQGRKLSINLSMLRIICQIGSEVFSLLLNLIIDPNSFNLLYNINHISLEFMCNQLHCIFLIRRNALLFILSCNKLFFWPILSEVHSLTRLRPIFYKQCISICRDDFIQRPILTPVFEEVFMLSPLSCILNSLMQSIYQLQC